VPKVVTARLWVCPRVKILEPCVRGRTEISQLIINITSGVTNYTYKYSNVTGENSASCVDLGGVNSSVSCQIDQAGLGEGTWVAHITAYDYGGGASPGNINTTSTTVVIDYHPPRITSTLPANNTMMSDLGFNFSWVATDDLRTSLVCNLSINESVTRNYISVTSGAVNTFTANLTTNFTRDQNYTWSVTCQDDINSTNSISTGNMPFQVGNSTQGDNASITVAGFGGGTIGVTVNNGTALNTSQNYSGTQSINVTANGLAILDFSQNFNYSLNFSALNISNGTSSTAAYIIVNGANASGGMTGTKTLYIYNASDSYTSVCIVSMENVGLGSFSSCGTGANNVYVLPCDNTTTYGMTCTKTGATLVVSGLNHSGVMQFSSSGGSGSSSSGSSNSGGGTVSGGGTPSSTKVSTDYPVDVGAGNACTVSVSREIAPGNNLSVLTTTLENTGGSGCTLTDFLFADTIPDSFAAITDITFAPQFTSREGWTVSFSFPSFAPGESKTITYSVSKWVPPSRLGDFVSVSLSAKKEEITEAPTTPITPAEEGKAPAEEGVEPVPSTAPASAPAPAAAPAGSVNVLGIILPAATLIGILLAVVIVIGAVYFLMVKRRRKGL